MHGWRKDWHALTGPLMIWVAFVIFVPFLAAGGIISLNILPALAENFVKTAGLFCVMILAPLAALAEIAPPFVTKAEVNWRNRNVEALFEGDVAWEDVPFLPSVLKRIRSTTGRRRQPEEKGTHGLKPRPREDRCLRRRPLAGSVSGPAGHE